MTLCQAVCDKCKFEHNVGANDFTCAWVDKTGAISAKWGRWRRCPAQNVVANISCIPVGIVADVHPVESGLYLEADVKLSAKLSSLEEVWVLFP